MGEIVVGDLALDFSGLFGEEPSEKRAATMPQERLLAQGEYKTLTEAQKPAERNVEGESGIQAVKLWREAQKQREDHQRSLEVFQRYQENTKTSEQLQTAILKGLRAGEDVYALFLQAVQAIALMTGNKAFYSQAEADLTAIYGRGLQEKPPLQMELQSAQGRLQRLLEAEERETERDNRERIARAIAAHRGTIAELERMIAGA